VSKKVADVLFEMLVNAGVKRCYGIVGDALNPVIDALRRNGGIEFIQVRHEEYGVFAAVAEAYMTGHPVAVCGTAGPGVVHLFNGLMDARKEGAPIIAIAGDVETSILDTFTLEELNPYKFFDTASLYTARLVNPEQARSVFNTAILTSILEKGPTVISLPGNIASMEVEVESTEIKIPATPLLRPADPDLKCLVDMIDDAKTVAIFGGDGCRHARDQVVELAEKLKAPVGYALRGKQWLEHDNPNAVGMTGLIGYGGAYGALHEAELLLMLGTDFPFSEFLPGDKVKKVQIDKNPKHIGRRTNVDLGLVGDIKSTLDALLPRVQEKTDIHFLEKHIAETNSSTTCCSTTLIEDLRSSPSARNSWPKRSAIRLRMTQCFSLTRGRLSSGWRATSVAAGIAGFSAHSHGHRWRTRPQTLSAHSWHIQGGKPLLSAATEASQCLTLAIS